MLNERDVMSGEGTPGSIFDEAGKKKGGKKGEGTPPPLPKLTREELDALIKQVYSQHDKVEKQLDELYQRSGFSPDQISQFLSNAQNLSDAQRGAVEERKNRLKRELEIGKGKIVKEKGKEGDDTAKRKGKTLGGRKGWISM